MTIEQAKKLIPGNVAFVCYACNNCDNEDYCVVPCSMLRKAKNMPYDVLIDIFAMYDGNIDKMFRAIGIYLNLRSDNNDR